jgi:glucoamylase
VVTAGLGSARLWVTLGGGVINEIYWPTTGTPQVRLLTFMLRVGRKWTDVAQVGRYGVAYPGAEVPLPTVTHRGDGYELVISVIPDPLRDAVVVRYDLRQGDAVAFQLMPSRVLAVMTNYGFDVAGVGYSGTSDALTEIATDGEPSWGYDRAESGSVAISALLAQRSGAIALALSDEAPGARALAGSLLAEGADEVLHQASEDWSEWASGVRWPDEARTAPFDDLARTSLAVLKVHEDVTFPGAIVASLSLPWGNTHEDAGGYHLVWPRDAVQSGLALLAAGQVEDARRVLAYLIAMQSADGHWPQNFYPTGRGYWTGLQLDETALPVVLAAALRERGAVPLPGTTHMVRRAVGYLTANGPTSPQDRWEENPGANAFTLATTIAALTAAAPWLEGDQATDAQDVADEWNERVESWTYVVGTPLAAAHAVDGYYVRLSPPVDDGGLSGTVQVRNRQGVTLPASALVSMDFLALARYGLRDPHDPRVVDTTKVVDEMLAVRTPSGTVYKRYNEDGYGEHDDGSPYDGTGVGRPWPLLAGERGHYALQRGDDPLPYLATMEACTGPGGLLPEQVWDGPPIPERRLQPGKPTGGAMPLAWAHAEFLKLYLACSGGRPFELLDAVAERYGAQMPAAGCWRWRNATPIGQLPVGRALAVECDVPFTLHFGWDGWEGVSDEDAAESMPGRWIVRFGADVLEGHDTLQFTRRFAGGWEGHDHEVTLQHPHGDHHLHTHLTR